MNSRNIIKGVVPVILVVIILSSMTFLYYQDSSDHIEGQADIQLTYTNHIENIGEVNLTSMSVKLALLKSWGDLQTVDNLIIETQPNEILTDKYSNTYAYYSFDEFLINSSVEFNFHANLTVNILDYSSISVENHEYEQNDDYLKYSAASPLVDPTNPIIVDKANELSQDSDNILDKAFQAYKFSSEYLNYQVLNKSNSASFAITNGYGDCDEYQNLFLGLSKAMGIPAVQHTAWFADFTDNTSFNDDGAVAHAYPMFMVPGQGLVPSDPTRGKDNLMDNWLKKDYKTITLTRGPDNPYRLLKYNYTSNSENLSPVIQNNYTISIDSIDVEYKSPVRTILLTSLFVFPSIFILYNIINGIRVKKERKEKLDQMLDPSKRAEIDDLE